MSDYDDIQPAPLLVPPITYERLAAMAAVHGKDVDVFTTLLVAAVYEAHCNGGRGRTLGQMLDDAEAYHKAMRDAVLIV